MSNRILLATLISGETEIPARSFQPGLPQPPLSVGSSSAWPVQGEGVLPVHLYIAWDGERLYLAAAQAAAVECNGAVLGPSWTEIAAPARVRFGEASLMVSEPPLTRSDFSPEFQQKTQLLWLPQELRARLLEGAAQQDPEPSTTASATLGAVAPPSKGSSAICTATTGQGADAVHQSGTTLVLEAHLLEKALQRERTLHTLEPGKPTLAAVELGVTLYDGGALREHALGLANALRASGAHGDSSARAGSMPVGLAADGVAVLSRAPTRLARRLAPLIAAWRNASAVRRATALMLPLAALGLLWPTDDAKAGSSPAQAGSSAPIATSHRATDAVPGTPPAPAGSLAAPAEVQASLADEPSVPVEPTPTERLLEAQALGAAFSGDTAEATRSYERLAKERQDPRFALAVHLVRTGATRRP